MKNESLFESLNVWTQLGFLVNYDVLNQIDIGCYRKSDSLGENVFVYKFSICFNDSDILWSSTFESILEGFESSLDWLTCNKVILLNDYLSDYLVDYNYLLENNSVEVFSYESENCLKSFLFLDDLNHYSVSYNFDSCEFEL